MAESTPRHILHRQVSGSSNCGGPWRRSPVQVSATVPLASASPTRVPQRGSLAEQALGQKQPGWTHSPGQLHGGTQMQVLPLESCLYPAAEQKPETATGRREKRALLSPQDCLDKPTFLLQHPFPSQALGLVARRL